LEEKVKGGQFVNTSGEVLGTHNGYPFYTIGQRKGLGLAFGEPMYVTEIQPDTNTVVLGKVDELLRNGMKVSQINSMKYEKFPEDIDITTQIRYNDRGTMSRLKNLENDMVDVEFLANVKGVAPGQSAVFYEGDDVIGGGIIYGSSIR